MRKTSSGPDVSHWLRVITSARGSAFLLAVMLLVSYAILPLGIVVMFDNDSSFVMLAGLTVLAVVALMLGASTPIFDTWFSSHAPRVVIGAGIFNTVLWAVFFVFVLVAWITAPQVPLIAAVGGADPDTIAVLREQFLKAREGWQASFGYISAILSGALIPYSLALMFLHGVRWRWLAAGFFLLYCISFLEKAFFLKAMLPLLYLVAQGQAKTRLSPSTMLLAIVALLLMVTFFAGSGTADSVSKDPFFSASYVPQSAIHHLIWRSIAIPLITAADAIRVFQEQFESQPLWGATSSFVAGMFDMERIEFERLVFAAQWGQNETSTGSANSVYITEAFVNFGWIGVAVFSYIIGLLMRLFAVSRDDAFRAVWPLFALGIYTSGLVGLLLSNGFALLFVLALFVRLRARPSQHRCSMTVKPLLTSSNRL